MHAQLGWQGGGLYMCIIRSLWKLGPLPNKTLSMEAHLQPTDNCDEDAKAEADDVPLEVVCQLLGEDRPHSGQD